MGIACPDRPRIATRFDALRPEEPEIVERTPVRSCVRRGAAIDLVLDRGRENRSQVLAIVKTFRKTGTET